MQLVLPTTAPVEAPRASSSPSSETGETLDAAVSAIARVARKGGHVVIACERGTEGVLGAVGATYLAHAPASLVRLALASSCQPMLEEQAVRMPRATDEAVVTLAERVYRGLERTLSRGCALARQGACPASCDSGCARRVILACASDEASAPEAVHRYVRLAFAKGAAVRRMISDPTVAAVSQLACRTLNECEHTRQFVRFSHLSDGSYLAVFRPNADTLPLCARHFADRMGTERFCIVDPIHDRALLHEAGARHAPCIRLEHGLAQQLAARDDLASDEAYVRAMWQALYQGLTLEGRGKTERGYDLRASWMPKRFWGGLTELAPQAPTARPLAVPRRYQG